MFKKECSLARINVNNCCGLTVFPLNKAPSAVYQMSCKCGGRFTTADVYCDMSNDYGGWIVIQRNKISSPVDFNRNWTDYEEGFGNLTTEFWYGQSAMHCLTQRGQQEMRVDYQLDVSTCSTVSQSIGHMHTDVMYQHVVCIHFSVGLVSTFILYIIICKCNGVKIILGQSRDVSEYIIARNFALKWKRIVKSDQVKNGVWNQFCNVAFY